MTVTVRKSVLICAAVAALVTVCGLCAAILILTRQRSESSDGTETSAQTIRIRQGVADLSEALNAMDRSLQKGAFSSSADQNAYWAAQVLVQAGAARNALESLPVYDSHLDSTEAYLNRVGEVAMLAARRQIRGEDLSESERETLEEMSIRARELADGVGEMALRFGSEFPAGDEAVRLISAEKSADPTTLERLNDLFSGEEEPIYDGTYSAWYRNRSSEFLPKYGICSLGAQKEKAARFLGESVESITVGERYNEPFGVWEFSCGDATVTVTDNGGFLCTLSRFREIGDRRISVSDAISAGARALESFGYGGAEVLTWSTDGNLLTATYTVRENGVRILSDRITVSVATDTGEVCFVDATEYLLSRRDGRNTVAILTEEEAAKSLSDTLETVSAEPVMYRGGDGAETLCYAFRVRNSGFDGEAIVLINAENGAEEKICLFSQCDEFCRIC